MAKNAQFNEMLWKLSVEMLTRVVGKNGSSLAEWDGEAVET
jgi:hypothetical protein